MTPGEGRRALGRMLRDPLLVTDLVQAAKAALAGAVAWFVATDLFGLSQPFLAPWAAVLVVHATVYRTFSRGAQQVAATLLGVVLAWLVGTLIGLGPVAMGAMLVVAFLVGRLRWLRAEATTLATTAIVVLATNSIAQENLMLGRLLDTTVGIVVGLLVNLVVWPPLRGRAAWAHAAAIPRDLAGVMHEMAEGMSPELAADDVEGWLQGCREVDTRIDAAWGLLRQAQESARLNPRRRRRTGTDDLVPVLHLLEQAVADLQSMARTVAISALETNTWDSSFRHPWTQLLEETASAVEEGDTERLERTGADLAALTRDLSTDRLPGHQWQEYGGLLVDLRNMVTALRHVVDQLADGPADRAGARDQSFSTGA